MTTSSDRPLTSYLSRLQLEKIAARTAGADGPSWEQRPGAALLIDAIGFTTLTNRFAAKGDAGVEELSELINAYFGRITDLVIDHGGDVVGFAGDSALAVWPVDAPERLAAAALLAAKSAWAVQRELRGFEPQPGISLTLRASIGAGTLTLVEVGGVEDRWHFLVAGDPIRQAVEADKQAGPGDIVLSKPAWELVRDRCRGVEIGVAGTRLTAIVAAGGPPELAPAPASPPPAFLLPYVPRVVVDRISGGQERWLGEFRNVSVFFVELVGMEVEERENVSRLHDAVGSIQRILRRHEGLIHHLLLDDKGTTLIGIFGLPGLAHARDPFRCVHAAMDVRELQGTSISIGVATGLTFCGVYGAPRRRQYTVLGPPMHRAARLMQGARGALFCDEATATAAASGDLVFDPLPPIRVKGESAPVMVYGPRRLAQAERAPRRPRRALVGRVRELATLERSLADLLDERIGGTFLISGAEAVGKSMLVDRLLAEARDAGVVCLVGGASETEQGVPYNPWRGVLKGLLELGPPSREDLAPLLGAILPLDLADTTLTRGMTGEVRAENTRRLVADELRRLSAERPALLVLEDMQWADSASWAMLLHAAREIDKVLIVMTARPMADPPEELEQLRLIRRFRTIDLGRFTREEVRRLIRDRLGEHAASDAVVELVHERAEGHPIFTDELVHALSETGSLAELDRLPAGAEQEEIESIVFGTAIPDTIRGLIHKRLDRLTAEQQLVLRSASVIGTHFEPELLRAIHPVPSDPGAVERHLAALEELDLVRPETPEPGARAVFRNRITREVAYGSMLFDQRRELHRRIAEWHEGREASTAGRYALLGHHWKAAGEAARASGWLGKAGEQALREHANRDAVRFLIEALELAGTDSTHHEERARWHLLVGRADVNLSRYEDALPHFEKGLARFGQRAPQSAMGAILPLLGQVALQGFHRIWPDRYLGRSSGREDLLQLIDAHEGLGEAHYVGGRPLPTLLFTVRSLNLAETFGPSGALARSYASAGAIIGFVPLRGAAEAYIRRALETARRVEDSAAEAWVSLATGVYKAGIGAWEEAVELLERVRSISQELGDRRRWEDATQHLATVAYLRGEFPRALELARHMGISAAGEAGMASDLDAPRGSEAHPMREADALPIEIGCLLRLGDVQDVPDRLETFKRLVRDHGKDSPRGPLVVAALEAQWSLYRGRNDDARAIAEAAVRQLAPMAVISYESLHEYWALIEALLAGGADNESRSTSRAAGRRVIKKLGAHARVFPVCEPATEIARGLLALAARRRTQGQEAFRRAIRAAERLRMPWFEAMARYRLSGTLDAEDSTRVAGLKSAHDIFERLGAAYDLELVRRETASPAPGGAMSSP